MRALWVLVNLVLATIVFGGMVLLLALVRYRGRLYSWATQEWARSTLWAAGVPVLTRGDDRVAWGRPLVLVSNHVAGWDIFALAAAVPLPFSFVGKKELNSIPFFGRAWRAAGHISIDRSNRESAIESLRTAGDQIRRDNSSVIIFPEGTRSRTGELQPFKKGAFMLALQARVQVVPVIVEGSRDITPDSVRRIRRRPITVRFGEPIDTSLFAANDIGGLMETVRERMVGMQSEL